MIENTNSAATAEWHNHVTHRELKRRGSIGYHHHTAQAPKYSHRNISISMASASPPRTFAAHPSVQIHQQSFPGHLGQLEQLNTWGYQISSVNDQVFGHPSGQNKLPETSWSSMKIEYNSSTNTPNSPLSPINNVGSPASAQAHLSCQDLSSSWVESTAEGNSFDAGMATGMMPGSNYGSFESFSSMDMGFDPSTMASSISDGFNFPDSGSILNSPPGKLQIEDLSLSDGYRFATMHDIDQLPTSPRNSISPISPLNAFQFPFDQDTATMPDWRASNTTMLGKESDQLSFEAILYTTQFPDFSTPLYQNTGACSFNRTADAGNFAFEPNRGQTYQSHSNGERYLAHHQRDDNTLAASLITDDSDPEGWHLVNQSSTESSSSSHNSPDCGDSPFSFIEMPSPPSHGHIFTAYPGIEKQSQKSMRGGRKRSLTNKEKKNAREVRDAKACWACHLSKIRCSPCSPGSPCKKCADLAGKRRFCLLPCFNDPLESLYTFMIPDYLMGHHTKMNVERFISKNATAWGSYEMSIQMSWGYWKPLVAKVVTLEIPNNSKLGFVHQTAPQEGGRPALVQQTSPPLGIPLVGMDEMEGEYQDLVEGIVRNELLEYLPIAYGGQESDLAERLLSSIGNFYCASRNSPPSELLRQALEVHVTSTILERSLILAEESKRRVESYLGQTFPRRSAARCVQRQIKLALYEVQRKRIVKVLGDWGSMMWTSNKSISSDKKWATSFSVLLSLILVIDKTLEQAYYFCEGRIVHHNYESRTERRKFQQLVRLTQNEVFERFKEIFHTTFKTRKNGKEACNPIRDGLQQAFKDSNFDPSIKSFIDELRGITQEFGSVIKSHRIPLLEPSEGDEPYLDAGRLSCIFLDDFLDH